MRNILQLFIRNGGFVTFVVLEVCCFALIVQYNSRQNAIFSNTVGIFGGRFLEKRQQVRDYFGLSDRVDSLLSDNAALLSDLANAKTVQQPYRDTFFLVLYDTISHIDSIRRRSVRPEYRFVAARAVGNSIESANNWIYLNRGSIDGVKPNMAVLSSKGIVGIVRHVSDHFSLAMSVLHRQTNISVCLPQHEGAFGSIIWEDNDPETVTLHNIPKHFQVKIGDKVETSGYSQMFPRGHKVGVVVTEPKQDDENPYFLSMKVKLSQDMSLVRDVFIVQNLFSAELDSLKLKITPVK